MLFVIYVLPAAMSLLGAAHMPYGYYELLRLVVTIAAAFVVALRWKVDDWLSVAAFGLVALTFNPIIKVPFPRDTWAVLNVVTAAIFLGGLWWHHRRPNG